MQKTIVIAVTLAEPGGVQSFIVKFGQWLLKKGFTPIILAGDGSWLKERCEALGIRFIGLKHMGRAINPIRDSMAVWELHKVLKELKPDAVHLNSSKMGAIGSLAARWAHVPHIVYRIGGWVFLEDLSSAKRWLYRTVEQISGRWKDKIICVHPSDVTAAQAIGINPEHGFVTIPNGIDLKAFEQALLSRHLARQRLSEHAKTSFHEQDILIGTLAHLYPPKDLPRYMTACRLVADAIPTARFIILGEGMERSNIEKELARLKLEHTVFLPGNYEQAQTLLAGLDLFVLPSSKEGMAWSILEAMAAKTPCVVTDVGANTWLLGQTGGWIVPPKQPQELARAIIEALKNPDEKHKRAQTAYERVRLDFPLERTMQANLDSLLKP